MIFVRGDAARWALLAQQCGDDGVLARARAEDENSHPPSLVTLGEPVARTLGAWADPASTTPKGVRPCGS